MRRRPLLGLAVPAFRNLGFRIILVSIGIMEKKMETTTGAQRGRRLQMGNEDSIERLVPGQRIRV